jgi:hypothetical protein
MANYGSHQRGLTLDFDEPLETISRKGSLHLLLNLELIDLRWVYEMMYDEFGCSSRCVLLYNSALPNDLYNSRHLKISTSSVLINYKFI